MDTKSKKLELIQKIIDSSDERLIDGIWAFIKQRASLQQSESLSENSFWEVIGLLDWQKEGDDEAVLEPAVNYLSQQSEAYIFKFYDWLSRLLYQLDGIVYAKPLMEKEELFSSDLFLYARCAVVANGKHYYERILSHPEIFPENLFFEALLELPEKAYKKKSGKKLEYTPEYIYETGFNKKGWGNRAIDL